MNIVGKDNIIEALGIGSLPDDKKIELLEKCAELVQQRLLLRLVKSLSESKREQFTQVLDSGDQKRLEGFLAQEAPDFLDWVTEETEQVKQRLLDLEGLDL
jgi:hypothetical protein